MKEKVVQLNHTERVTDAGSHLWEDYMKTILELYVKINQALPCSCVKAIRSR